MKGIHLRYLVDDVRAAAAVGVFQQGSVAFVPRDLAVQLITSGDFEPVTDGPLAKILVVRIGQVTLPPMDLAPPTRVAPPGPTDFELELEEEERRHMLAAATADRAGPPRE